MTIFKKKPKEKEKKKKKLKDGKQCKEQLENRKKSVINIL